MLTLVKRADAFVQKYFDAAIHWLMRTCGVSKGYIRRQMWNGQLALTVADFLANVRELDMLVMYVFITLAKGGIFYAMRAQFHYLDTLAEQRGLMNPMDIDARTAKPLWILFLVLIPCRTIDLSALCNWFSIWLWLMHDYLRRTPPYPPARKQSAPQAPLLAPQPA